MKNVMKAATLESKFPLLAVENGCVVSKEADVTVAFRVELPELFSVTGSEYEAIHSAWHKAVKVLPSVMGSDIWEAMLDEFEGARKRVARLMDNHNV